MKKVFLVLLGILFWSACAFGQAQPFVQSAGTALQVGDGIGGLAAYLGSSCGGQFVNGVGAGGALSCASPSGSAVSSFNGRTGAVMPLSGDYTFPEIGGVVSPYQMVQPLQGISSAGTPTIPSSGNYKIYFDKTAGHWFGIANTVGVVNGPTQLDGGGGAGTVTSITAGTGLSGGTITSAGTIGIANTTVTAGSYTNANITVNAQGQVTAAANGSGGGGGTSSGTALQLGNGSGGFAAYAGSTCTGTSIMNGVGADGTASCVADDSDVVATVDLTGQSANIPLTTLYTPATSGMYEYDCYTVETQAATTSSSLVVVYAKWDDDSGVPIQTYDWLGGQKTNAVGTLGNVWQHVIYAVAGQPISFAAFSYASSGATPMLYSLRIRLVKLQ